MRQQALLTLVQSNEPPQLTYEQQLADIRGMVWNSAKDTGQTWKDLADKTGLSYTTVSKFGDGTTKWPRLSTALALLAAVDIEGRFVPRGSRKQPDEIVVASSPSNVELRRMARRARFRGR